eukprot:5019260-Prymnesium_polylepis.1
MEKRALNAVEPPPASSITLWSMRTSAIPGVMLTRSLSSTLIVCRRTGAATWREGLEGLRNLEHAVRADSLPDCEALRPQWPQESAIVSFVRRADGRADIPDNSEEDSPGSSSCDLVRRLIKFPGLRQGGHEWTWGTAG